MHLNVAIELLKTLTEEEVKKLGEFLRSPYFNKSSVMIKLYDIIIKCRPDYSANVLKKENLFKKLYPGKNLYNESSLKTRMAELASLIRHFIAQEGFEKDGFIVKQFLGKELTAKKKYKLAEKTFIDQLESIDKEKHLNSKLLKHKISLLSELKSLYAQNNNFEKFLEIQFCLSENIIDQTLIELFDLYDRINSFSKFFNKPVNGNSLHGFFRHFNLKEFLNDAEIKKSRNYYYLLTGYYMYLLNNDPLNQETYFKLQKILYENYDKFDREKLISIRDFLQTTIYQELTVVDSKFYLEGHKLNKFLLERDVILRNENGHIPEVEFRSIFNHAIGAHDLEWAEAFVEKYHTHILPELKDNSYNFCIGVIHFKKGNYEKSLEHLSKVTFIDIIINFDVRFYTLANYFELNLLDQLQYSLDNMKHFFSNNQNEFPDYHRDWYKLGLKFLNKLITAKLNDTKIDYAVYKEAISGVKFYNGSWIRWKMELLLE